VTEIATDTQMRLLIIEDDRESADYLVKAFREVGYVADLAGDGEEGLALAEGGDYDVLVVDRMLPCARRAIAPPS
jgi:two-component system, OmpR family, response regulator